MKGLSGKKLPKYKFSSYRYFEANEKHVTRICPDDVLLIVLDGVLRFSENGEEREVFGGEYYIQEKELRQSAEYASDNPIYYYIHMSAEILDTVKPFLAISGKFNIYEVKKEIDRLEMLKLSLASEIDIYASFLMILSKLSLERKYSEDPLFIKMSAFISDHIKEKITIERLSSEFGFCKNYIIKLFSNRFGLTPHEYITLKRVDIAKNLLISSKLTVNEIAEESGFETYINMYKSFVSREHKSPLEFRKQSITDEIERT